MAGGIFLLQGDHQLVEMTETAYSSEALLQELLAKYPRLLAGEQIESDRPRRWLLIRREMPVPCEEGGSGSMSLDHLFIDQDAILTLIEVKRSSDTRIRREVVGQMLDYAANAVVYWPIEEIRFQFERECVASGLQPDAELQKHLEPGQAAEEFWQLAKANLQRGKIRMLFVADVIPRELQRIVEFLNEQMQEAEVLALEIKQFVGQGMKTLVPRIIGQTEFAQKKKGSPREQRQWDEVSFFAELARRHSTPVVDAYRQLFAFLTPRSKRVDYGKGKVDGNIIFQHHEERNRQQLFNLSTNGKVGVSFDSQRALPFSDPANRKEIVQKLNQVPGISLPPETVTGYPSFPVAPILEQNGFSQLIAVMNWAIAQMELACGV